MDEKTNYVKKRVRGHIFYFKFDDTVPELLHIYARHMTEPSDAVKTFFTSVPKWNEKRRRFENYSQTHGIFWFWINEEQKEIMIVTCFKIEEN